MNKIDEIYWGDNERFRRAEKIRNKKKSKEVK